MKGGLLIFLLIVGPLAAYLVVLTLPKWFARSLHGHRMWRLRDAVVDDVLDGNLPRDHEAVQHLIRIMDGVLHEKRATLLDVYIVRRACKGVDPAFLSGAQKQGLGCPLDRLSPDERKRVEAYRARFMTLLVGSMLLGSWFGIAHIVPFVPAGVAVTMRHAGVATRDGIRHRIEDLKASFERDIWASAREATDLAASHSRIGQQAAVFAMRHEVVLTKQDSLSPSHLIVSSRR
jgi:hypothetical protein